MQKKGAIFAFACVTIVLIFGTIPAQAHPGRTAGDGCHYCRTNCSQWGVAHGQRHCHQSKGVPQPHEPIRSHRDGTSEVWEPYKEPKEEYRDDEAALKKPAPTDDADSNVMLESNVKDEPSSNPAEVVDDEVGESGEKSEEQHRVDGEVHLEKSVPIDHEDSKFIPENNVRGEPTPKSTKPSDNFNPFSFQGVLIGSALLIFAAVFLFLFS